MYKYILKRLLMFIPVLLGVTFMVYFILSLSPGDPIEMIAPDDATPEMIASIREELGLNQPVIVQYARYMGNLLTGNFGISYYSGKAVVLELAARIPATLRLASVSLLVALVISIPIGVLSATKQYSLVDGVSTIFALTGVSMPNFWLGLLLIILFSLRLGWLPSGGSATWRSMILPAITLGTGVAAAITRTTRSSMLEVVRQDYIRTAMAKGLSRKIVIRKHALRNAFMPVVTVIGLQFGTMLGGSVLTETVFSWPGMGRLIVDSIKRKDTPTVLGCLIVFALAFSIVNLLVDILYAYLDPRIKSQYK